MKFLLIFSVLYVVIVTADRETKRDEDGNVVVEGDIIYSPEEWEYVQQNAIEKRSAMSKRDLIRARRKAIIGKRWNDGLVKFDFKDKFSTKSRKVIAAAMSDYTAYTCLRFEYTDSKSDDRVTFVAGPGCQSNVGRKGRGSQKLYLDVACRTKGTVIHEMGHAIGWEHEQARADRDDFVKIVWKNVEKGFDFNFKKYKKEVVPDWGVKYDYKSVMHYGPLSFSKDKRRKLVTIKTRDPKYQDQIGQRESLSFLDIEMANIMYKCNEKCGNTKCPKEGFLGKDCKCWCPTGNDEYPAKHCDGGVIKPKLLEIKGLTDYKSDCEDKEGEDCLSWISFCKSSFLGSEMKKNCPDTCGFCK